jgi:hypothetical protein
MGRIVSFPVVEIGFVLSQRHCRFLFLSVVIVFQDYSKEAERQVTTANDLMEN